MLSAQKCMSLLISSAGKGGWMEKHDQKTLLSNLRVQILLRTQGHDITPQSADNQRRQTKSAGLEGKGGRPHRGGRKEGATCGDGSDWVSMWVVGWVRGMGGQPHKDGTSIGHSGFNFTPSWPSSPPFPPSSHSPPRPQSRCSAPPPGRSRGQRRTAGRRQR